MPSFVGHCHIHSLIYGFLNVFNIFVYTNFSKFRMNLFECICFESHVSYDLMVYQHLLNLFVKMPNELRSIRTYVLFIYFCVALLEPQVLQFWILATLGFLWITTFHWTVTHLSITHPDHGYLTSVRTSRATASSPFWFFFFGGGGVGGEFKWSLLPLFRTMDDFAHWL